MECRWAATEHSGNPLGHPRAKSKVAPVPELRHLELLWVSLGNSCPPCWYSLGLWVHWLENEHYFSLFKTLECLSSTHSYHLSRGNSSLLTGKQLGHSTLLQAGFPGGESCCVGSSVKSLCFKPSQKCHSNAVLSQACWTLTYNPCQ